LLLTIAIADATAPIITAAATIASSYGNNTYPLRKKKQTINHNTQKCKTTKQSTSNKTQQNKWCPAPPAARGTGTRTAGCGPPAGPASFICVACLLAFPFFRYVFRCFYRCFGCCFYFAVLLIILGCYRLLCCFVVFVVFAVFVVLLLFILCYFCVFVLVLVVVFSCCFIGVWFYVLAVFLVYNIFFYCLFVFISLFGFDS